MNTPGEWSHKLGLALVSSYASQHGIELNRVIKSIQADALRRAAGILEAYCEPCPTDWGKAYNDIQTEIKFLEQL